VDRDYPAHLLTREPAPAYEGEGPFAPALRLAPAPEPDPFALDDDATPGRGDLPAPRAVGRHDTALEGWARACWPTHLCAVLRNEVGRAVEAGVLSPPEAEFLVARLTVVIDQAIGVDDI
jgi:hypothetical protein